MNTYNDKEEISLIYDENNKISPKSNLSWVVYDGKKFCFKPMQFSEYLKENRNERFNFIVVKKDKGKKNLFVYRHGVYELIDEDEFKGFIRKFIPQDLRTKKSVDEVYADLITDSFFVPEDLINNNEDYINFQDGLLNLNTMELEPHNCNFYSTIQIPTNYNDVKNCTEDSPVFNNYLDTLCSGDENKKQILLQCVRTLYK